MRRVAHLVKLLALAPGHRMPREELLEMLWPRLGAEPSEETLALRARPGGPGARLFRASHSCVMRG